MNALPPAGIRPLADGVFGRPTPNALTVSVNSGEMVVRAVVSTIDPDRAGDVVVPAGLRNRDEFRKNPVVLWAHNRTLFPPIGTCQSLDVQPERVVAETKFAQGLPFAEDLFRLYEQGVLRGWSIGFVPRRAFVLPPPRGAGRSAPAGLRVEEWDLLEYSAVPVPENPGALTVAVQKGLVQDATLRDWLAAVPDDPGGRWWRVAPAGGGDVLAELFGPPV